MISISNLTKIFEDNIIFEKLNINIESGEYIIFSGKSGCGKTTLLNMIGGLEPFNEGSIIIDGIDISNKRNHLKFFGEKVGFLFQNFALIENKTVRENLEMVKKSNRTNTSIEDALKSVGLLEKIDNKIYSLSGGEQQRVALSRLMIKKCDIILADEPTGSLDSENAIKVLEILEDLWREGKTLILVTHDEKIKMRGKRLINLC